MDRRVYVIGVGMGREDTLTRQAEETIGRCGCLIGAERLVTPWEKDGRQCHSAVRPDEILACVDACPHEDVAILMSGDVGFFSGAQRLCQALEQRVGAENLCWLPGISSVQTLCARLHRPWQQVEMVSLHGREGSLLPWLSLGKDLFVLTGGNVQRICEELTQAGYGNVPLYIGQRLSYPEEKVERTTPAEAMKGEFDSLSVLLLPAVQPRYRYRGEMEDGEFLRGKVPMTKQEVRTVALARLRLPRGGVAYDVGAGTGSVAVELALRDPFARVYAIERKGEAAELIAQNREHFGAWNLLLKEGLAPQALEELPPPDSVFVGGSGGRLAEIVELVRDKNPRVRVVVTAISLETIQEAAHCLKDWPGYRVTQLQVSRGRMAGAYTLMTGENPIYLFEAGGMDA
ncbi:MAG: precorrin-6y C5,15-methyltransferase (decarboxylating) subunit CbiE [Eubacteriales bacterium]|jgi:precorrin-6Y C5,15-methyltransferase (decarboxylating)